MDEFAQLARENFEVFQRYSDAALGPDPKLRAIAVYASARAPATYVEEDLSLSRLPEFFKVRASRVEGAAELKLVVVDSRLESWSNFSSSLWVTKDAFLGLVDATDMHPAALWLLRSEYDGFHHFPPSSAIAGNDDDEEEEEDGGGGGGGGSRKNADTYYVGTSNFVLVWTFDQRKRRTRGLWILRQQHNLNNSAPTAWFTNVLRRHLEHARSPFLLAYVAALSTCCTLDGEISYRAHIVRLTEREIGYSALSPGIEERLGMGSITGYIKDVGEVLNHIANKERHFRLIDSILDFLDERTLLDRGNRQAVGYESTRCLFDAIPLIRRRLHASQEYLRYLKERAERLSTVLFALLTHEDSATNTELADASRRIAEAARRDSSSMRTVAVMTMAFLPATFFAALFALPTLDWGGGQDNNGNGNGNGPVVAVRSGFWVYWAFTLPATAIVFALWLLLDYRGGRERGDGGGGGGGVDEGVGGGGGGKGGNGGRGNRRISTIDILKDRPSIDENGLRRDS